MTTLAQIDAARKKQQLVIARIQADLKHAGERHDWQAFRKLRVDLDQAQRVAIRLDQIRGERRSSSSRRMAA
jgi:hypothetical protein